MHGHDWHRRTVNNLKTFVKGGSYVQLKSVKSMLFTVTVLGYQQWWGSWSHPQLVLIWHWQADYSRDGLQMGKRIPCRRYRWHSQSKYGCILPNFVYFFPQYNEKKKEKSIYLFPNVKAQVTSKIGGKNTDFLHTRQGFPWFSPVPTNLLHTLIRSVGRITTPVSILWLYRRSRNSVAKTLKSTSLWRHIRHQLSIRRTSL